MMSAKCDVEGAGVKEVKDEIPHDHLFMVTGLSSSNLEKLAQEVPPADFEAAMAATGSGRFNVALMLCALPAFWGSVSMTGAVSFIFVRAKCDMNLSLVDMGTLTGITYGGMVTSAMMWGFLSDTLGRKNIMVAGFLAAGVLELASALSQTFATLLVTRFLCGFLFNGPFAVLLSYIAEMHRADQRSRAIVLSSLFYAVGSVSLPLLAWCWLTQDVAVTLLGGRIVLHSWNLFMLTTATPTLVAGLAFISLPESPMFLMSRGRNQEALAIFQWMFVLNTGKPVDEYPIKWLVQEKPQQAAAGLAALRGGLAQMTPLFKRPHLLRLALVCLCNSCCMLGANTLRLWYPQLAAMMSHGDGGDICAAIAPGNSPQQQDQACVDIETDLMTYVQSSVVGAGTIVTYSIGGMLVNRCGKRLVAGACGALSAAATLALPLAGAGAAGVVALVTASLALTSLAGATLSGITIDLFPTSLRVMALALFLTCGRLGTVAGTAAFPALVGVGCLTPFVAIAVVTLVMSILCYLLPNTTTKRLQ